MCKTKEEIHALYACLWLFVLPHKVIGVVAIPSGWAVYVAPLWRHECVGLVSVHKQIWNHKILLDKNPYFDQVRFALHVTNQGQVK